MKLPGFLTPRGMLLGVVALLAVAVIVLAGGSQIFSPGPLNAVNRSGTVLGDVKSHADLITNCAACHTAPWSSQDMADGCLTCHKDVQAQLTDPAKLHGMLQVSDCRECHTEHGGAQASLTRVKSLIVDHEKFRFSLATHVTTAEQQPFRCANCHTESLARFAPSQCGTCHNAYQSDFIETHTSEYGANCQACHDGSDRFTKGKFDHNQLTYALLGKHAMVPCADCHKEVRDLAGFKNAPTDCVDCHQEVNKHPANFGTDCARCHNSESWATEIFDHNLSAYKLTGKHVDVACAACHVDKVFKGTPQTCVRCHLANDPHNLMLGTKCEECHTTTDWKKTTFDHNTTGYPLTGKHAQVACANCHVNNIFRGTPKTCVKCHAKDDVHKGQFGTDCAACHNTDTWKRGPFEHIFPLDHGGGGIISCTTCHTVPGNYKTYTCYNCHNPLDIEKLHWFARMMRTDITDCVRCHPTGRPTMMMH